MEKDILDVYKKLGVKKAIDAHVHVELEKEDQISTIKELGIDPSMDALKKEMKENGIERIVLLSEDDEENGRLAKMDLDRNKVLVGMYVDPFRTSSGGYLKTIEGYLKRGTFGALKLYPGYEYFEPSEEKCRPLFELARQYSVPVVIHTGDTHVEPGSDVKPKVKYARPYHVDDAAVEFPEVKFVIAHAGNPWVHDAAEVAYKNANVFVDISGWFVGKADKRDIDVMKQNLSFLLSFCKADKIIYGTDWPLVRMADYLSFVQRNLKAKKDELEKMMYKNAVNVFWK